MSPEMCVQFLTDRLCLKYVMQNSNASISFPKKCSKENVPVCNLQYYVVQNVLSSRLNPIYFPTNMIIQWIEFKMKVKYVLYIYI